MRRVIKLIFHSDLIFICWKNAILIHTLLFFVFGSYLSGPINRLRVKGLSYITDMTPLSKFVLCLKSVDTPRALINKSVELFLELKRMGAVPVGNRDPNRSQAEAVPLTQQQAGAGNTGTSAYGEDRVAAVASYDPRAARRRARRLGEEYNELLQSATWTTAPTDVTDAILFRPPPAGARSVGNGAATTARSRVDDSNAVAIMAGEAARAGESSGTRAVAANPAQSRIPCGGEGGGSGESGGGLGGNGHAQSPSESLYDEASLAEASPGNYPGNYQGEVPSSNRAASKGIAGYPSSGSRDRCDLSPHASRAVSFAGSRNLDYDGDGGSGKGGGADGDGWGGRDGEACDTAERGGGGEGDREGSQGETNMQMRARLQRERQQRQARAELPGKLLLSLVDAENPSNAAWSRLDCPVEALLQHAAYLVIPHFPDVGSVPLEKEEEDEEEQEEREAREAEMDEEELALQLRGRLVLDDNPGTGTGPVMGNAAFKEHMAYVLNLPDGHAKRLAVKLRYRVSAKLSAPFAEYLQQRGVRTVHQLLKVSLADLQMPAALTTQVEVLLTAVVAKSVQAKNLPISRDFANTVEANLKKNKQRLQRLQQQQMGAAGNNVDYDGGDYREEEEDDEKDGGDGAASGNRNNTYTVPMYYDPKFQRSPFDPYGRPPRMQERNSHKEVKLKLREREQVDGAAQAAHKNLNKVSSVQQLEEDLDLPISLWDKLNLNDGTGAGTGEVSRNKGGERSVRASEREKGSQSSDTVVSDTMHSAPPRKGKNKYGLSVFGNSRNKKKKRNVLAGKSLSASSSTSRMGSMSIGKVDLAELAASAGVSLSSSTVVPNTGHGEKASVEALLWYPAGMSSAWDESMTTAAEDFEEDDDQKKKEEEDGSEKGGGGRSRSSRSERTRVLSSSGGDGGGVGGRSSRVGTSNRAGGGVKEISGDMFGAQFAARVSSRRGQRRQKEQKEQEELLQREAEAARVEAARVEAEGGAEAEGEEGKRKADGDGKGSREQARRAKKKQQAGADYGDGDGPGRSSSDDDEEEDDDDDVPGGSFEELLAKYMAEEEQMSNLTQSVNAQVFKNTFECPHPYCGQVFARHYTYKIHLKSHELFGQYHDYKRRPQLHLDADQGQRTHETAASFDQAAALPAEIQQDLQVLHAHARAQAQTQTFL